MRIAANDARIAGGLMLGTAAILPLWGSAGLPTPFCPLLATTGVPCPLCGMTTSVVAAVHGDLVGSVAANPFGLVAIGVALWLLVDRRRQWLRAPWWLWGSAVAVSWAWQLVLL